MSEFAKKVLEIVKKIPKGKVVSYKEIAIKLGNKNLARAVGQVLKRNPYPIIIPCHRVIKSDGKIGGYSLGIKKKKELLKKEGILIIGDKVIR
ncbi:MAG: MGMT family protein [candidate division WOR-3 bacterium]|nr:MGMT family protein [candidate division WOR-3 bacterium]MDW8114319.1 MGMT family protein [candidate division WOR-3 bacterium]